MKANDKNLMIVIKQQKLYSHREKTVGEPNKCTTFIALGKKNVLNSCGVQQKVFLYNLLDISRLNEQAVVTVDILLVFFLLCRDTVPHASLILSQFELLWPHLSSFYTF